MTTLQISAHKIAIEKGRYAKPLTPVSERICKNCIGNNVEDDYHFLIECDTYQIQQDLFTKISIHCKQFQHLGSQDRFIYQMHNYNGAIMEAYAWTRMAQDIIQRNACFGGIFNITINIRISKSM